MADSPQGIDPIPSTLKLISLMKRLNHRQIATVLGAGLFTLVFVFAGIGAMAREELELKMSDDLSRPPVRFPHESHLKTYDCFDCHHDYDSQGNNVLEEVNPDIMCGACHNSNSPIKPREAFHRQCLGCHEQYIFNKRPTGPVLCGECHIKEKEKIRKQGGPNWSKQNANHWKK